MLPNVLIFCISTALAATWFVAPLLQLKGAHFTSWPMIIVPYIAVFACLLMFYGLDSVSAVMLLSILIAVLAKLLVINFKMVRSANYPKHRRCY